MSGTWTLCVSIALLLVSTIFSQVCGQQSQSFGTSDISQLLKDEKFVKKQISCVLGEASCDNYGNQLKLAIPEVISRNCRSCSAQQAANARKLISFVQKNYPQQWQKIQARYKG